ncbi:hypothetical protein Baya_16683 [Bagarius yarrelli]|uniref:Uncharacterized protein n=1 Tax=Bagarius yarrelli TaxID=175774 RepID=A0A556VW62_BAGYA|nr:hypothetical protein Baya_16683 [Bagarius yarrelli]
MGSSSRTGFPISDSDSEQLPVIDFSQKPKSSVSSASPGTPPVSVRPPAGNVFVVSSDSEEEEEVFVPLAVRLKQKSASESQTSSVSQRNSGSDAQCDGKTDGGGPGAPRSYGKEDEDAGVRKRKRTAEEMEEIRDEALRRKAEREKQHGERERLRAERKALTDAVKAMRPDECLKHLVVLVDPGGASGSGGRLSPPGSWFYAGEQQLIIH